jgi:hypothetical protein
MMSNWKKSQTYCYKCRRWYTDILHKDCPKSGWFRGKGGLTWIDIENYRMGCNKCNQTWVLEDDVFYCPYGHVQETYYTDSAMVLETTDTIVKTDGNHVWVLKASGAVVVGYSRDYHGLAY